MSELKENEICIGNYLMELTSDDIFTVSISWFSCIEVNLLCSRPIPLTEEWLVKFGFENREFSFDKSSFYLIKRTAKPEFLYQSHTHRFDVKYVHQLQNLYFANRQEELTHQKIN